MFLLPHEFAVPDLLFKRELKGDLGERLLAYGLRVEALDPHEVAQAAAVKRARAALSTEDTFAYALAQARGWTLLTGDGGLRSLALEEQVQMHGVLWIFDQLFAGSHVENARLHTGMTALQSHRRCRLPANEMAQRLVQYAT